MYGVQRAGVFAADLTHICSELFFSAAAAAAAAAISITMIMFAWGMHRLNPLPLPSALTAAPAAAAATQVAAATSATMIMFTAASACVVYSRFGQLLVDYAIAMIIIGFCVTLGSQLLTFILIKLLGRRR